MRFSPFSRHDFKSIFVGVLRIQRPAEADVTYFAPLRYYCRFEGKYMQHGFGGANTTTRPRVLFNASGPAGNAVGKHARNFSFQT